MVRDDRYIDTIEQQWKEKETSKTMEKAKRVREAVLGVGGLAASVSG